MLRCPISEHIAWTKFLSILLNQFWGYVLGQQLMCRHSAEGEVDCLGIFPIDVERFLPENKEDKVPAMGWNQLNIVSDNPLLKGLSEQSYAYFVHSYYVPTCKWTTAEAYHILPFSACLCKDNFYATQFHPEKSGKQVKSFLIIS